MYILNKMSFAYICHSFRIQIDKCESRIICKVYKCIISPVTHKDMGSLAIQPGDSFTYLWKLTSEDGPMDVDPRCLTRLYQSTLNPEKDLASGLVGPLIICKPGSLDRTGRVVRAILLVLLILFISTEFFFSLFVSIENN